MSVPRVVVFVCLVSVLFAAGGWASAGPVNDQIAAAVALPDGAGVVLDAVYVESVIGGSASVRDTWAHSRSLLIFTDAAVQANWTVKVTGQMTTIDGQRVLIASAVQLYATIDGSPAPPVPASMLAVMAGVSLVDIPPMPAQRGIGVPMNTLETTSESMEQFDGSIASAKRVGGTVTLTGKVVTAVLHDGNGLVSFFYIQEPGTGGVPGVYGIKVVPGHAIPVEPGNEVELTNCTVVPSSLTGMPPVPECYISAPSVKCTGNKALPRPLGVSNKLAAGGHLGLQQALHSGSVWDLTAGIGIVGTRVRVWGKVSAVSGNSCWIDDGTGLKSDVGGERIGIRVIYESATPPAYPSTVAGVTGILGAEMDGGGHAVPVVRVPKDVPTSDQVVCVDASSTCTSPSRGWANAFSNLQDAIDYASDGDEIWVAAGTYYGPIIIDKSIALYGGFAGGETDRDARDWAANETILDGDEPEVSLACTVVAADPGSEAAVRIDGFTIRNGHGYCGGGVGCSSGHLIVANNVFVLDWANYGGGVGCTGSSVIIWNNLFGAPRGAPMEYNEDFANITGGFGGAIYLSGCDSASLVAANSICSTDRTWNSGGVTVACFTSPATIVDNVITDNFCLGIRADGAATLIANNTIASNREGGLYVTGGWLSPSPIVASNIIRDNAGMGVVVNYDGVLVVNNTIVRNDTGIFVMGTYASTDVIANNIVAFNTCGVAKKYWLSFLLDHNCFYNPRGSDYVGVSPGSTDVLADPEFIRFTANDFHLEPYSPCVDAGNSARVEEGWLDFDGRVRVQGTHVDIGAYETSPGAPRYVVWFLPVTAHEISAGSTVSLSAAVSASGDATHLPGRPVTFEVVSGPGSLTTASTETSSSGGMTADTVLSASAYGRVEVKASTPDGEGGVSESRLVFWFYDPARTPVDLFFCLDCTFSMELSGHSAEASIQALLDYLVSNGVRVRAGGVKFDLGVDTDGEMVPDQIEETEKQPFDWFDDLDGFAYWWLADGYSANGGDWWELQLDALDYAVQEMNAHATDPRKFIVLVTDAPYHYLGDGYLVSTETKQDVTDALTASGCSVFISLWDESVPTHDKLQIEWYDGLAINNGAFDTADYGTGATIKYPFAGLRARIVGP